MEPKSPQFSAYDFLGYLLPGLVLIGLLDCSWHYHVNHAVMSWDYLTSQYSELDWNNAIPLALVGYFFGHMVSFVSSIVIEGHAARMHGFPSAFLVRPVSPKYFFSGSLKRAPFQVIIKVGIKALVGLFILPVGWIEWVLARGLGLSRRLNAPMKPMLRMCVTAAENRLLDALDVKTPRGSRPVRHKDQLHWCNGLDKIGLHYALEMAPAHLFTLRNYVVLYGFLRAMTLILLVVIWVAALHAATSTCLWAGVLLWLFGGALVAPCYGAFLKFWSRYHREALMAFIAASAQIPGNGKKAAQEIRP